MIARSNHSQRGAVSLFVTMALLIGVTMIAFFAMRSIIFEQRTSANQYRSTKALEAAEAGLEWALAMLNAPVNLDETCSAGGTSTFRDNYLNPPQPVGYSPPPPPDYVSPPTYWPPPAGYPVFAWRAGWYSTTQQACTRQSGGGWLCSCPAGNTNSPPDPPVVPACDLPSGACAKFVVRFERVQDPNPALATMDPALACATGANNCVPSAVKVTSVGYTDTSNTPDGTATVSQVFKTLTSLSSPPGAPLTAKDYVNLNGNLTVSNTDPSTSGITINSGSTVTLNGSASVVSIPGTPPSASIAAGDSTLAALTDDQMFMTYFGMSKTVFQNLPTTYQITCSPSCRNSDLSAALATGANTIWVNGDLDLNAGASFGTVSDPIIVVVTDNIHVNGTVAIVGVLYSQASIWDNSGGGTATICGAAIAEGAFSGQGTPSPTYCPVTLDMLKRITGPFARVPGSWRDF